MKQMVLASTNLGKLREFQAIFKPVGIDVIAQSQLNVPEVEEPYSTFIENALHKARHCSKYCKLPALADDSGLCVDALGGAPGVLSARYAGESRSAELNIDKLVIDMESISNRRAHFYCCLVFVRTNCDPQPIIADGILCGKIAHKPRGVNGHGYDPIFWMDEYNKTLAQLEPELKNQISHRALALSSLLDKFRYYSPYATHAVL